MISYVQFFFLLARYEQVPTREPQSGRAAIRQCDIIGEAFQRCQRKKERQCIKCNADTFISAFFKNYNSIMNIEVSGN